MPMKCQEGQQNHEHLHSINDYYICITCCLTYLFHAPLHLQDLDCARIYTATQEYVIGYTNKILHE
jgi:hypothetical protein